ncbi:N-acetyl-gamma-glutamyl-phosphate reductase [Fodinisporobacter ferrooxydans]|uniref:N-acetyl-gamma-glutamyl-phosphate reductase n=1 Tax=Fodinisporobacter ferrooxydans TaxID=2901836 RepID=A0ABY4CLS7_9BACL|nr:N-acetyl-gamma-glutamyl-phosphate reductase [Alicyclobacillaceae bacterium MYW30-H2]
MIDLKVAIIGATGYAGIELVRLLLRHPEAELTYLTSDSYTGQELAAVYPHLTGLLQSSLALSIHDDGVSTLKAIDVHTIAQCADVVFLSLPAGLSSALVPQLLEQGLRVIDLGGDHRIPADLYEAWYKKMPADAAIFRQAVYGLTEIARTKVAGATFISNPGCYTTAAQLAILPSLQAGWIDGRRIIIDAKSGVSGAGRGVGLGTHFSEINENFKAYKIGAHQHTPEIEYHLSLASGQDTCVTFAPHLVPMTRGILATSYLPLQSKACGQLTQEQIYETYQEFYQDSPFVRIRPIGQFPQTKEVYGTNYCDIGLYLDQRTKQLIAVSVIDNLVKGAAGQAVQNLNVMYGLDETTGLEMSPLYP